uniref:Putative 60S ribosomal protein L9-1-like n=1 Tax=Davidia involucrata TaxID=16924 RepID=A0A5B6ZNJ6_DAVIN
MLERKSRASIRHEGKVNKGCTTMPPGHLRMTCTRVQVARNQDIFKATRKKKLKIDAWFSSRKITAIIRTALSHVKNLMPASPTTITTGCDSSTLIFPYQRCHL